MGVTKDFITATIADALTPTFRRPVEDLIYETLDRRQIPTRTDFKELRDIVNNLRGQVSGATNGLQQLATQIEALDEALENTSADTTTTSDSSEELQQLSKDVVQLKQHQNALKKKLTSIQQKQKEHNQSVQTQLSAILDRLNTIESKPSE